ncbi:MAG: hypothetical protein R3C45_15500 [Phycisphaerales bacterium]
MTPILSPIAGLLANITPVVLAFRPFLDPVPVDRYWMLMLLPMVVAIAVVYKTIKTDRLEKIPRETTVLAAQIVAFMVMAAAALWMLTELV